MLLPTAFAVSGVLSWAEFTNGSHVAIRCPPEFVREIVGIVSAYLLEPIKKFLHPFFGFSHFIDG